jgi:hypothetical protein
MRATPTWNKARRSSKLPAQIAPAAAAAQRRRPPHLITTVSRASKVALRVLRRSYGAKQPRKRRDLYLRRSCVRWRNVRHFSQTVPLTVKLRGRAPTPDGAEGAQSLSVRGADPQACHGPLQRWLDGMRSIRRSRSSIEPPPHKPRSEQAAGQIELDVQRCRRRPGEPHRPEPRRQ